MMTKGEAQGVERLQVLLDERLNAMARPAALAIVDDLSHAEFAEVMEALAAAQVALNGRGNLLYESAASRLRAVSGVVEVKS